jgi:hypothetical protein
MVSDAKLNRKDRITNIVGHTILFILGLALLYAFYRIDESKTVAHYFDTASGDPSGFRFMAFLGILKYGILLTGIALAIMTPIMLFKNKK